jgi:hypothetical protein
MIAERDTRTYWLSVFTLKTWQEFMNTGANVASFRTTRWKSMQNMKQGDYLLCYLSGVRRLIGILEVNSAPFFVQSEVWNAIEFPCRVKVNPVVTLNPEMAVPIHELKDKLSIFQNLKRPSGWNHSVLGSPTRWKVADGEVVVKALKKAAASPSLRPV